MAQPPFQADGFQVEPAAVGTRTIDRDPTTGAMRFKDPLLSAYLSLTDLANLATVSGVLTVGKSGAGAKYTTLQAAVNAAIPTLLGGPMVILVFPGTYTENLTIEKDNLTIIAMGGVVLTPLASAPTVTVQTSVTTTPRNLTLRGLTVLQPNDGQACVSILGGAGSVVGSTGVYLESCTLAPSGIGCYTVYADTVRNIFLTNCDSTGVPSSTVLRTIQCLSLVVIGGVIPAVQSSYTTAGSVPGGAALTYEFVGCRSVGNILGTFSGASGLRIANCPVVGNVTMNGDRALTLVGSAIGTVTANGTSAVNVVYSSHGTASGAGTLAENLLTGTTDFVGVDNVDVTFPIARPSASYSVSLDAGVATQPWVTAKATTGFTIQFPAPVTLTVAWTVAT